MSVLSERLVLLREHAGLTQAEVAKMLQVGRSTYSNYENDYREPNFQMIEDIAKIFNVPIAYLFGDIEMNFDASNSHYSVNTLPITTEDLNLLRDINQLSPKHKYELRRWIQKHKIEKSPRNF